MLEETKAQNMGDAQTLYEFLDFAASLKNLKEFLAIRDREAVFEDVRQKGSIGIPCIVREDGSVTLSWEEFLPM